MMDRALIVAIIALFVVAAAVLVLRPAMCRRWGVRLVARFADVRGGARPVLAARAGPSAGLAGDLPMFAGGGHDAAGGAANAALLARLEGQILANLSRAMPINLYYVADDEDCVSLAETIWDFLGETGFRRGEYAGTLKRGSVTGLRVTMKAESCDMMIAPPR